MRRARLFQILRQIALCWATFGLAGCDGGERAVAPSRAGPEELRIVSLSPALSRMIADLGLADSVVGRTRYCLSVPEEVPIVGDHFEQDFEALVRLEPTHVLIQPPKGQVNPALRELANDRGWQVCDWTVNTITDVRAVVRELPTCFADHLDPVEEDEVRDRADHLIAEMDGLLQGREDELWGGRVLLVYSIGPGVAVFGDETYLDGLLEAFGSRNAAASVSGWGELSLEDVTRLNPEAIILVRSDRTTQTDATKALGPLAGLPVDAVRNGRLAVLAHPEALLPSTSILDVAAELKRILSSFREQTS